MTDRAGQAIEVGSKVGFGVRVGNSGSLRLGEVVEIVDTPNGKAYKVEHTGGSRRTWKPGKELVVYG